METFWFFQLQLRWTYDTAYNSDLGFSLGLKLSYDSVHDSNSYYEAGE